MTGRGSRTGIMREVDGKFEVVVPGSYEAFEAFGQ